MSKKSSSSVSLWRQKIKIATLFPYLLLVFGFTGAGASVIISIEKQELLKHPKTVLACDLNPIYSCGNVIDSKRSALLGIPNELIGIMMFTGIFTVGLLLLAGAKPKEWFFKIFMAGMTLFSAMTIFLWHESVYVIGSLCIFCSSVWFSGWAITMALFTYTYDKGFYTKAQKDVAEVLAFIRKYNVAVWALTITILVAFTLNHFWYYYGPRLGF